ncbi:uncharacterized protein LOC125046573 [Penaeus chinensis]|uniref:uncharacterized protein LOC125046573 n=1 Tax=Penaeus chinensis TaxID=139456 RepID=UPI001FB633C8|nr:uncharacterized protein LOC125046573 [Penaeus chinensis]XP_047500320.1 uncharacterized protein LOC125046573 [Penaeus chinensis]XP_047500321.1 uncharacterized protein LOC125046573 [Penaeus chinensis]
MGPRPQKGTYSKVKPAPKTEEEKRKHFKQRKVIPKFSDLFINKDENESDPFDAVFETSNADHGKLKKSKRKVPGKQRRPLTVNNTLLNSSLGSSHNSANDTFDKLLKEAKLPSVVANSSNQLSSSAGSSLEVDGILYQSLFSSVACSTATAQNHDHKEETKHVLPTKESKKDTENKRANKRKKEREEKGSKSKTVGNNGGKASARKNAIKEIASVFPSGTIFKIPVIQLRRTTSFTTPPVCRTQKKIGEEKELAESPFEVQSKAQEVLRHKSSDKGDVITSTPADVSRLKAVVKDGKTWSMPSTPTLEHFISPVPKESYLVALSNSSDFESPMSFKSKSNIHSNHEGQSEQSAESRYETCSSDISSKSSDSLPAVASEAKGTISACHLNKENYRDSGSETERFYNSSLELESGPFKGVVIPSHDRTRARKSSFGLAESSEPETSVELSSIIGLRNVGTARTLKNKVTTRKKKAAAVEIRNKFESSADLSNLERSLAHLYKRNGQLTISKQNLRINTKQLGSKLSLKKSWAKPSPVLTRLRQKAPRQTKIYDISLDSVVSAQENSKSNSKSQLSGTEKSLVIGRRKRISKEAGCVKNRIQLDTSDTDTSLVIPRRPPKKLSVRKKVKDNTSLKPSKRNSQFMSDADLSSVSVAENSQVKRRSGRLLAMKRQTFVPSPKLLRRKYAKLCKNHLEESATKLQCENENHINTSRIHNQTDLRELSLKNLSRMSAKSVQVLEATAMSFGSVDTTVFTDFQTRKERRGNQLVYCKLESSGDMFDTSDTHISEVHNEESDGFEEPQVIDKDLENSEQTSSDEKDVDSLEQTPPSGDSCPLVESSIHENSLLELEELEDVCRSVKVQCMIPVKGGKGWRRSCLSMAAAKIPHRQDETGIRRQTVHTVSDGHRRRTGRRISAIPQDISRHIQQMGTAHKVDMHSSHHTSFHAVVSSDASEPAIPSDPREYVLKLCSQVAPVPIDECFTESRLVSCKKIGEGVYGEVFMTRPNPNNLEGATVLKIMPIEGDFEVNGEPQKKFGEIVSEIVISLELSNLRKSENEPNWTENYVNVLNSWCVQGSYIQDLLNMWDVYNEEKGSENDRPDLFPDSQLYIVLEFGHGGGDLESYVFNNAGESLAVFLQIAYSLAVAEQELEFEHRDLHWGNVLVAPTKESMMDFRVSGATYRLPTKGLKATVIDFTLSRLHLKHCVMYNNLGEDPSLFTAEGDYQFEIYRQMRKANGNDWEKFTPYTNVLWLHYILDKMIGECYYKKVKTKVHSSNLAQLRKLKGKMLSCESATDFVFQREMNI